jgi:hypothetical protein
MVDEIIDPVLPFLRGLEILTQLDQIIVKPQYLLDYLGCCSSKNIKTYKIFNSTGQEIFDAEEQSTAFSIACNLSTNLREFSMNITDHSNTTVMNLVRPRCRHALPWGQACFLSAMLCCMLPTWCYNLCGDSCMPEIEVYSGTGTEVLLGTVKQEMTNWSPEFIVQDAIGNDVLKIRSYGTNMRTFICCERITCFDILTFEGEQTIGKIFKEDTGGLLSIGSQAGNFGVTFPLDLHLNMKATILCASFLIYNSYFQNIIAN